MDIKDNSEHINKRKFFRVYLKKPICTEASIVKVNEKSIKTNITNICVNDIGIGGIRFSSKLQLPVGEHIVYEFKFHILHKYYHIRGAIVWQKEDANKEFQYGVKFLIDDNDSPSYFTLFNNLAFTVKRNKSDHGCNFCDIKNCPNPSL